jgi:hypothetical protein
MKIKDYYNVDYARLLSRKIELFPYLLRYRVCGLAAPVPCTSHSACTSHALCVLEKS